MGRFSAHLTPHGFLMHNTENGPLSANQQIDQRLRQELVKIRGNDVAKVFRDKGLAVG